MGRGRQGKGEREGSTGIFVWVPGVPSDASDFECLWLKRLAVRITRSSW